MVSGSLLFSISCASVFHWENIEQNSADRSSKKFSCYALKPLQSTVSTEKKGSLKRSLVHYARKVKIWGKYYLSNINRKIGSFQIHQ